MSRTEELVLSGAVLLLFVVLWALGYVPWWVPAGIVAIRLVGWAVREARGT